MPFDLREYKENKIIQQYRIINHLLQDKLLKADAKIFITQGSNNTKDVISKFEYNNNKE